MHLYYYYLEPLALKLVVTAFINLVLTMTSYSCFGRGTIATIMSIKLFAVAEV